MSEGVWTIRVTGAAVGGGIGVPAVLFALEGDVLAAGLLAIPAVIGFVPLAAALLVDDHNVGRGRTWRSRVARQIATLVLLDVRGCGCLRADDSDSPGCGPEWVEYDQVWVRELDGAKVRFRKSKVGLRRCQRCGKHYHDSAPVRGGITARSCWPEDEPDIRAKLDERVVDQEVADA